MEKNGFILSGPKENCFIPSNTTIGEYFFQCLRKRNKDEIINIDAATNETLTCGKFLEQTVKLVHVLQELGVKKGDVITISSENSIEFGIPTLAAIAMGVTINMLNPHYAVGEIRHALNIAKPKLIICTERTVTNCEEAAQGCDFVKLILLMGSQSKGQNKSNVTDLKLMLENVAVDTDDYQPDNFDSATQGCISFLSSGTSGLPKCVLMTHQELKSDLFSFFDSRYGSFCGNSVVLTVLPFCFMYGCFVLLSAFVHPLKLIILNKFDPNVFLHAIQFYRVSQLPLAPPLLLFIAKSPLVKEYDLSSIEDIVCGGAPLGLEVAQEASNVLSTARIRQAYGLTELGLCTVEKPNSHLTGSIGKVVLNCQAKVWNAESKKNMGPFEIGELCFKNFTTMKYRDNRNTFHVDEQGFLHTQDIGYYDNDGSIFITGRMKDLIKYKGFQVSPTEIENILLEHPDVKDCGVIGIPNERAGEAPFAFIVCKSSTHVTEQDLVKYVADRISFQKQLHGGAVFVDEIPKNSTGKILRRKLQEMVKELKIV